MTEQFAHQSDVVISSIFGRGNWLAMELATRGWKVDLVDFSDRFDFVAAEDREGPFGLFEASDLLPSQVSRLTDEEETELQPQGFTIWLREGPLELHGEMTSYLLKARGIPETVEAYLRAATSASKELERLRRRVKKELFANNWLAQLAHDLTAKLVGETFQAIESSATVTPLLSRYRLRRPTSKGERDGLKLAQGAGVSVHNSRQLKNLNLGRAGNSSFEFTTAAGKDLKLVPHSMVWMLSSIETEILQSEAAQVIYPKSGVHPLQSWVRLRASFKARHSLLQVPSVLVIDDVFLPWEDGGFFMLKRHENTDEFDVWLRVANEVRDLTPFASEVARVLEQRLPGVKVEFAKRADASGEKALVLKQLWPRYRKESLEGLARGSFKNFYFSAQEDWPSLDWLGRFRHETQIFTQLQKIKSKRDAEDSRASARSK